MRLNELIEGVDDAVVTGFLRIVTNRAVVSPAATTSEAFAFVDALRQAAWVRTALGSRIVLDLLRDLCANDPGVPGTLVPDAYLPPADQPTATVIALDGTRSELTFAGSDQYGMMVDAFARSVAAGKLISPAEDGLGQMRALDAILADARG